MSKKAKYLCVLYEGRLADPGDRNPYAGRSLVLEKLWRKGYERMIEIRIGTGPAMARYRGECPCSECRSAAMLRRLVEQ